MTDTTEIKLIDISAIFRAAWHVDTEGEKSIAYQATIDAVTRIKGDASTPIAICCDDKGNWRKELSKEYKAHRETQPATLYHMLDRVKDRLRKDGHLVWEFDAGRIGG